VCQRHREQLERLNPLELDSHHWPNCNRHRAQPDQFQKLNKYANVLVQELTLLLIVMQVAGAPSPGGIEMWFPDPVPVGSLLTLWQGADMWEVLLAATKRPAAAGRIEGPSRPDGRCAGAT
jgi:hypothetical protein